MNSKLLVLMQYLSPKRLNNVKWTPSSLKMQYMKPSAGQGTTTCILKTIIKQGLRHT